MLFSEPKIPQSRPRISFTQRSGVSVLFSEPKIPQFLFQRGSERDFIFLFQCSSASRKFLNRSGERAEGEFVQVSVLFSEPKIPQWGDGAWVQTTQTEVSVLFSEPKIPQLNDERVCPICGALQFQCSSASRKFLNAHEQIGQQRVIKFQCSSASRKFLNLRGRSENRICGIMIVTMPF